MAKKISFREIALTALSTALVLVIGAFDYATGIELGFSLFYLAPLFIASFLVGRTAGFIVGILSAVSWTFSNQLAGFPYFDDLIVDWNIVIRSFLFGAVAYITAALKAALEREKADARKDFVTGIANTMSFYEIGYREIERCRRYGRPLTIAYIDCDNFKAINDTFGHKYGDSYLKSAARLISGNVRNIDLVARIGGDEFIVLLPETDYSQSEEVMKRIRSVLLDKGVIDKISMTYSIGVATFTDMPATVDEMVSRADSLMYLAKKEGKNLMKHEMYGGKT